MAISRKTVLTIIIVVVLLLGVVYGLVMPVVARELSGRRGAAHALADIDAGELRFMFHGCHRRAWYFPAAREMKLSYGIDLVFTFEHDDLSKAYESRYNAEIIRHLSAKHGRDVVTEIVLKHYASRDELKAEPPDGSDATGDSEGREK